MHTIKKGINKGIMHASNKGIIHTINKGVMHTETLHSLSSHGINISVRSRSIFAYHLSVIKKHRYVGYGVFVAKPVIWVGCDAFGLPEQTTLCAVLFCTRESAYLMRSSKS